MSGYRIFVRRNGARQGELEAFTKFQASLRFNNPGPMNLTMPWTLGQVQLGDFIDLEVDNVPLFSGKITGYDGDFDEASSNIIWTGTDESGLLENIRALPVPSTTTGDYSGAAHDVQTGVAETVMKYYVNANCGPGARSSPVNRQIITAIDIDLLRGSTVTGNARFDKLTDLLNDLASTDGLGWRVLEGVFYVYATRDLTSLGILRLGEGISKFKIKYRPPTTNFAIVGGQGDLTARVIKEVYNSASIAQDGLYEALLNRTDLSAAGDLIAAGAAAVILERGLLSILAEPNTNAPLKPWTDYWLADTVKVDLLGVLTDLTVRSIDVTLTQASTKEITSLLQMSMGDIALGNTLTERRIRQKLSEQRLIRLEQR